MAWCTTRAAPRWATRPRPGTRSPRAATRSARFARRCGRRCALPTRRGALLNLQQHDHVRHEQDREEDRPAIEVALDERAAPERAGAGADAEGARQSRV